MIILYFFILILIIYILLSLFSFLILIKRRGQIRNEYAVKLDNLVDTNKYHIRNKNLVAYYSNNVIKEFLTSNNRKIYCELTRAAIKTKKVIISLHGYQSDGRKFISNFYGCYYKNCLAYNLCIPDFYGCGKSSGNLQFLGKKADEVISGAIGLVYRWIGEDAEIYLHGVSLGAYNALSFVARNPSYGVKGLILDSGFINPYKQILHLMRRKISIFVVPVFPIWYRIFFGRWYKQDSIDRIIKKIDTPLMIVHGSNDNIVPQENAQKLFDIWSVYKQLRIVKNALHGQACFYASEEYYSDLNRFVANQHLNRIALIGVMGAGKTTLGAMLAKKFNVNFVDIDAEIVKDTNKQLTELFANSESEFRRLEFNKLAEFSNFDNIILSCGGGTPQIEGSEKLLSKWTIIHLKISPETAFERSKGIKPFARPWKGFKELCEERIPLYDKIADFTIINDNSEQSGFFQLCELIKEHNLLSDEGNNE